MMKGKYVITSILVLAFLCAAPVAVQAGLIQWNNFAITRNAFEYSEVKGVVEKKSKYRLADWRDIVLFVNGSAANAVAFTDFVTGGTYVTGGTGFDYTNDPLDLEVWVALNGDEYYNSSTRHYFARVPGRNLDSDFEVFASMSTPIEDIEDGVPAGSGRAYDDKIVLGSWNENDRHILLIDKNSVPVPTPEPATLLLLGAGLIGLAGFGRKKLLKN